MHPALRSAYYGRHAKEKESHYWNSYIIDPQTGEVKKKVKAISEWVEKELVVVDIYSDEVIARHSLDVAPVELAIF